MGVLLGALPALLNTILSRLLPEDPSKAAEIQAQIMTQILANDNVQAQVDAEEAKSPNLFVAGWRPMVGWICTFGFAWAVGFQPLISYILVTAGLPHMPQIDTGIMMNVLFALLGMGGLRSWEKYKGLTK